LGARGSVVVEALCYKPEGRGIAPWIFSNLPNPSGRTTALWSTKPKKQMITPNHKKKKKNLGVKGGRRVGLITLPPSVSRLSK
jgi:hypothetical protein